MDSKISHLAEKLNMSSDSVNSSLIRLHDEIAQLKDTISTSLKVIDKKVDIQRTKVVHSAMPPRNVSSTWLDVLSGQLKAQQSDDGCVT